MYLDCNCQPTDCGKHFTFSTHDSRTPIFDPLHVKTSKAVALKSPSLTDFERVCSIRLEEKNPNEK